MSDVDVDPIEQVLGPEGLLASALERYEHRPQQVEMARAVERALGSGDSLIVEAATGTGKTLAYLIPALRSGKRVVVSTGTKALQEQLFHKDIPFLAGHWGEEFDAVLLKGRRNYLCKWRLDAMMLRPSFRSPRDAQHWGKIMAWAGKTKTGDRAEIDGLPDDYPTWQELSISSDSCLGGKCRHYETCFITQARKQAREAALIVVNHHLFFADLSLRHEGAGELLPDYDAVIFDEAHHLEQIASGYFGVQVSNFTLGELLSDIRRALAAEDVKDDALEAELKSVSTRGTSLFTNLGFALRDGRYELADLLDGDQSEAIEDAWERLAEALTALERLLKAQVTRGTLQDRVRERVAQLKFDLDMLMSAADLSYTFFVELRERGVYLNAEPIDLATILRERLLDTHRSLIFTSATLSTGGDFEYFKQRLGMNETLRDKHGNDRGWKAEELQLDPVFDYPSQSLLYIPKKLPDPNHPAFRDGVVQIVEYLLGVSEGRAFVLFTSWANMNAVHDALVDRLPYTVMRQGDRPKRELLDAFKADEHSVLFATSSFWEGVDVEGDALRLVIIDKLPFASPTDPVISARVQHLEARGLNAFDTFTIPQAALTLKQGFGRLIRSREDRGVVAILDSRIANRRYGKHFLDTLPPAPVVWNAPAVRFWWYEQFGWPEGVRRPTESGA